MLVTRMAFTPLHCVTATGVRQLQAYERKREVFHLGIKGTSSPVNQCNPRSCLTRRCSRRAGLSLGLPVQPARQAGSRLSFVVRLLV